MQVELQDDDFSLILSGLYARIEMLTDELSAGPSDDNPGWEEDALLWAIRSNVELLRRLVDLRPELEYTVADIFKLWPLDKFFQAR